MTAEQEQEFERLRAENAGLHALLAEVQTQLAVALERITELEAQLTQRGDPPAFVKPNRQKATGEPQPRKKRAAEHNTSRKRMVATRIERHALERCPECAYRLSGESLDYSREVVELPPPQPVEVIAHQVVKRWCPHCARWRSPQLDLTGQVFGQGRIGVRIASVVAYLRTTLRLPNAAGAECRRRCMACTIARRDCRIGAWSASTGRADGARRTVDWRWCMAMKRAGGRTGRIWLGLGFCDPPVPATVRYYEYDPDAAARCRSGSWVPTGGVVVWYGFLCGLQPAIPAAINVAGCASVNDHRMPQSGPRGDNGGAGVGCNRHQLYDDAQTWLGTWRPARRPCAAVPAPARPYLSSGPAMC